MYYKLSGAAMSRTSLLNTEQGLLAGFCAAAAEGEGEVANRPGAIDDTVGIPTTGSRPGWNSF